LYLFYQLYFLFFIFLITLFFLLIKVSILSEALRSPA